MQSNKPIMEKRRRARINHCLNELKALILDAMKKDVSYRTTTFFIPATVHSVWAERQKLSNTCSEGTSYCNASMDSNPTEGRYCVHTILVTVVSVFRNLITIMILKKIRSLSHSAGISFSATHMGRIYCR